MSARRILLENLDIQALRGSIHRGGQPAGPRADDDQIAHLSLIDFVVQPEAGGRFGVGGIAKCLLAAADQDRDVRDGNSELLENRMDGGVGLDIEIVVRMCVAGEELPQPHGIARMDGPDQHRIAHGVGDQKYAARYEGVQEYLTQRGIRLHDVAQVRAVDFEQRAGLTGQDADQGSAARQHVYFAGEFAGAENPKRRPTACGNIPDFKAALQDDEDAVLRIALIHNHCTRLHIPLLAKWG